VTPVKVPYFEGTLCLITSETRIIKDIFIEPGYAVCWTTTELL
jgi:hypothetical protein